VRSTQTTVFRIPVPTKGFVPTWSEVTDVPVPVDFTVLDALHTQTSVPPIPVSTEERVRTIWIGES